MIKPGVLVLGGPHRRRSAGVQRETTTKAPQRYSLLKDHPIVFLTLITALHLHHLEWALRQLAITCLCRLLVVDIAHLYPKLNLLPTIELAPPPVADCLTCRLEAT